METDHLGTAFHFPDMGSVPQLATKTRAQELLASWLDAEDVYCNAGGFADQLPDLQLLDDDFFQFATADFGADTTLLSSLLPHKSSDDDGHRQSATTHNTCGFLPDNASGAGAPQPPAVLVPTADDAYHPTLPDTCCFAELLPPKYSNADSTSSPLMSDSDMFLADDFYLIAPNDSFDGDTLLGSSVAAVPAATSSSSTSTAAAARKTSVVVSSTREPEKINAAAGATSVPVATSPNNNAQEDEEAGEEEEEEEEAGEEEEEEEEVVEKESKPGTANCKNLVSERNRRKRLSQQLLALRALVPNITKMDKRSVLVDALAYLRSIQEETARIQAELKERARSSREPTGVNDPDPNQPQQTLPAPSRIAKPKAQILEIDTEKIEERRFVVKMTCKGESGVGAEVLRVIESLGFEITYTAIEQLKPQHVLTTVFIRVRRQGRMTEDKLKDCITSTALRSGLTLPNP